MVDHGSLAAQSGFPPLVATMLLASLLVYYAVGALNTVCSPACRCDSDDTCPADT